MAFRSSVLASRCFLSVAALLHVCGIARVQGQTILETYNDSLTTYLAGASSWQGVQPRADQRAVQLDGTLRATPLVATAIAGNPWGDGAPGRGRLADIRLDTGTYSPTEVDLSLPSKGIPWVVGRTYNVRQGSASNGPQGRNWFQSSRPEIKLYSGATTDKDVLYILFGADRYIELQKTGVGATTFKSKNGAAGVAHYVSGSPDTYIYSDQNGNQLSFFGGNTGQVSANWQLWKATDPAGNTAYTGHATTASTAVTNGFSTGGMTTAYDATGRRYTYTYSTIDSTVRLTQVKAELNVSGTWTEVGKVDYDYYASTDTDLANGNPGNLRLVSTTTPLTPASTSLVRKTYYRYDTTTDAVTYVTGPEGTRALSSYQTASSSTLKPYTMAYFEYDGSTRINKAFFNGECGCSGGNNGEYGFTYNTNSGYSDGAGYDTTWAQRTVIKQPDNVYQVRYFDETGQALSSVIVASNPATYSGSQWWATEWVRNSDGQTTAIYSPAAVTGYTHDAGGNPSGSFTHSPSSAALATRMSRVSSGYMTGFVEGTGYQDVYGNPSSWTLTGYTTYAGQSFTPVSGATVVRPYVNETREYHTATAYTSPNTSANYDATTYSDTFHSATASSPLVVAIKDITTTAPAVSTGKNGSGSATSTIRYLRTDGTTAFTKTALGVYSYSLVSDGQTIKTIADVDATASDVDAADSPSGIWGWSLPTAGTGARVIMQYAYDQQGRVSTATLPTGRTTKTVYSRLSDHRIVVISIPRVSSGNWYGPLSYSVNNQMGRNVFSGIISLSSPVSDGTAIVDPTTSDPITAKLVGTLSQVRGSFYTSDGVKLMYSRLYTTLPSTMAASTGFDETTNTYDDAGRVIRTVDATGTITRTVYNTRAMPIERSVGTNDNGLTGGSGSGTNNMTVVEELEYDGGNSNGQGNGLLTKRTQDADGNWGGTSDQRVTQIIYDFHNRPVIQQNAASPHVLTKYDNLDRAVAVGEYSTTSGLTVGSDPAAGTSSNRTGLRETSYDERGSVWKSVRHEIVQSNGNKGNSLTRRSWYDADGRTIKTTGQQITKTTYDRLGRTTGSYTLHTSDDGTTYANVSGVAGDVVVEESHSAYETGTGRVLSNWTVQRPHNGDFWVTGGLDANTDTDWALVSGEDIFGRLQITAQFYDAWDRPIATANYGTYGINADGTSTTDFDRAAITSVPSTSGTVLVQRVSYDDDGSVKDITDPKGVVRRTLYDTAGRRISTIDNYTDGTVGGGTNNDQDRVTEYTYATGGRVATVTRKMTGAGNDQTTTYTYGVVKSGSSSPLVNSDLASNRGIACVTYAEQTSGQSTSDRSSYYAYNALGQGRWVRDPSGNIIEVTYDTGGRQTTRTASTIASGFDSTVISVHTAYNIRGTIDTVGQKNSSGVVLNEIAFEYDDWGNLKTYKQDPDSSIGGGSGRADYKMAWTYTLNTPATFNDGWEVVRLDSYAYPDGTSNGQSVGLYYYSNTVDSRPALLLQSGVGLASYEYLGASSTANYCNEELALYQYTATMGYADYQNYMDRFNRPTKDYWTRIPLGISVAPVVMNTTTAYDEVGLPKYTKDFQAKVNVSDRNFDRLNTWDSLRRLVSRQEGEVNSGGTAVTSGKESRNEYFTRDILSRTIEDKVDLNGNAAYTDGAIAAKDAGEMDDTRTFSKRGRPTARSYYDKDNVGSPKATTLVFDKNDNLIDDGDKYEYVYNPWCQLASVKVRGTSTYVAKYTYNALGQRLSEQYDTNRSANDGQPDGSVNSSDPVFYIASDPAGRRVATFRGTDTYPKETFVYNASRSGIISKGGVLLRDRNASLSDTTKWATETAGATRGERMYYLTDHRGSVAMTVDDSAGQVEHYRYSATGVPTGLPAGDVTWDGKVEASTGQADKTLWDSLKVSYDLNNITNYDIRGDLDLDGDLDSADSAILVGSQNGKSVGRGELSSESSRNNMIRGNAEWAASLGAVVSGRSVYDPSLAIPAVAACFAVASDDWKFTACVDLKTKEQCEACCQYWVIGDSSQCEANCSKLPSDITGGGPVCNGIINRCKNNPIVKQALAHLAAECYWAPKCPSGWKLLCQSDAPIWRPQPHPEDQASPCLAKCEIHIWAPDTGGGDMCGILADELINAADACRFKERNIWKPFGNNPCGGWGLGKKGLGCEGHICDEMRSTYYHCCADAFEMGDQSIVDACFKLRWDAYGFGNCDKYNTPGLQTRCKPTSCTSIEPMWDIPEMPVSRQ
jgi:YD repeat-containing protein